MSTEEEIEKYFERIEKITLELKEKTEKMKEFIEENAKESIEKGMGKFIERIIKGMEEYTEEMGVTEEFAEEMRKTEEIREACTTYCENFEKTVVEVLGAAFSTPMAIFLDEEDIKTKSHTNKQCRPKKEIKVLVKGERVTIKIEFKPTN